MVLNRSRQAISYLLLALGWLGLGIVTLIVGSNGFSRVVAAFTFVIAVAMGWRSLRA